MRALWRARAEIGQALWRARAEIGQALWRARAEIGQALGIGLGWALLTWGLASLLVWQVWPISAGLLVLSVVGWGFLLNLFRHGLYSLTRNG